MNSQLSMFDDHWQNIKNKGIELYIEIEIDGEWYFIYKPHQDRDELVKLSEKGRKFPFRWLTSKGAVGYAIKRYSNYNWKVKNWDKDKWNES